MAPHSSTLAWKIPWTEEPGGLQSMGSWRVGHDWTTSLSLFTFMHWRRKWQPTPVFLPGESQGRESWWAAVYGVAQSQTRLKRLSSSSSITHSISSHPEEKSDLTDSWISKEKPDMWSPGHSSSCPLVRTLDLKELMIPWTSLFSKQSMVDSNWTGKTG